MRVEALRSAGGAKPRNEVTKGSSKDYSQPILLLLFDTKERDPSTPLRSAQDDTGWACSFSRLPPGGSSRRSRVRESACSRRIASLSCVMLVGRIFWRGLAQRAQDFSLAPSTTSLSPSLPEGGIAVWLALDRLGLLCGGKALVDTSSTASGPPSPTGEGFKN